MSDRAGYVIVRDGKVDLFYDRYGAPGSTYSFMDGPQAAADFAISADAAPELPLDDELEAGYLLDFDRRCALAFGEPDGSFAKDEAMQELVQLTYDDPQQFLARIAERWEGWTLRWVEGAEEFDDYLRTTGVGR